MHAVAHLAPRHPVLAVARERQRAWNDRMRRLGFHRCQYRDLREVAGHEREQARVQLLHEDHPKFWVKRWVGILHCSQVYEHAQTEEAIAAIRSQCDSLGLRVLTSHDWSWYWPGRTMLVAVGLPEVMRAARSVATTAASPAKAASGRGSMPVGSLQP